MSGGTLEFENYLRTVVYASGKQNPTQDDGNSGASSRKAL